MDKIMQDKDEMQEEELYALLDKAMETERLCVSEDLIQRTLKRVAESEDTGVISFEEAKKKRRISPMKYAGVAVAAVAVLFLGVHTLGNGKFSVENASPEAVYDGNVSRKTELLADSAVPQEPAEFAECDKTPYYSYSITDGITDSGQAVVGESTEDQEKPIEPAADSRGGEASLQCSTVKLSERTVTALKDAGIEPADTVAEYWEFVCREENWEETLLHGLASGEAMDRLLPEQGTYRYVLTCADGSQRIVKSEASADVIIGIKTEQGMLWGLLGETVSFYCE